MYLKIFISFFLLAVVQFPHIVSAQKVTVLEEGTANDSSYYEIFKVTDNEFWIGGKYGILKKVDSSGNISSIDYPNSGNHILSINSFDEHNVIVTGDKGLLLLYDQQDDIWKRINLNGYEKSSFYRVLTVNDTTAFISGGSSIVAFGGKALPKGFILKSTDKGKNWKKIYGSLFNMVWDIFYDSPSDKIFASTFSPLKGNIISTSTNSKKWTKLGVGKNMLIHALIFDQEFILGGTSRKNINKTGSILDLSEDKDIAFDEAGSVWSVNNSTSLNLFTASNGHLFYYIKNGNLQKVKTTVNQNLYESSSINPHSFYIVGSKKTLLRLDFEPIAEQVLK